MKKTNEQLFQLYGKVQKGDKQAISEFVSLYNKHLKNKVNLDTMINRKTEFHIMYCHLDTVLKR